jgi:hypothetical protein
MGDCELRKVDTKELTALSFSSCEQRSAKEGRDEELMLQHWRTVEASDVGHSAGSVSLLPELGDQKCALIYKTDLRKAWMFRMSLYGVAEELSR